jgi:VWFA-related protein
MRFKLPLFLALTVVAVLTLFSTDVLTQTQAQQKKRPKLKDFGSSLQRLKWDPITKRSVAVNVPSGTSSDEDDVIRIETNLVTCDVLVVDRQGNLVSNLTADDFSVTEDGAAQQVGHFRRGDSSSISRTIVLIIDYSGSQFPFLRRSIDAAKLMVDKLAPLDVMAIVTDDVELLIDFTNDKDKLKKKLESLVDRTENNRLGFGPGRRFGKSAQYSALMATLSEAFIEEDLRPIIVLQTDGDELYNLKDSVLSPEPPPDLPEDLKAEATRNAQSSLQFQLENMLQFSLADIYRTAEKSRATIYTVIPGYSLLNRTPEQQLEVMKKQVETSNAQLMALLNDKYREKLKADQQRWRVLSPVNLMARAQKAQVMQMALAAVAPRTGGWTEFLESPEQAEGIYNRILADINHRYIVGYYPTNKTHDGARRKIKFEVKGHPDYHVLGRNAYYAPGP